jgi:hypothetical protein
MKQISTKVKFGLIVQEQSIQTLSTDFAGLHLQPAKWLWTYGVQVVAAQKCAAAVTAFPEIQVHGHVNAYA